MSTSSSSSSINSALGNQTLSQADFMNLLVTQMTQQDPLNPESDTDFAAQLAQFSNLQATQGVQTDLSQMQANSLIGQSVTVNNSDGSGTTTGTVTGVQIASGTPEISINGQVYQLNQISAVTPPTDSSSN